MKYLQKLHFNSPNTLPTLSLHTQVRHAYLPPLHSRMNKPMEKSYYIALCALGTVCLAHQKTIRYTNPGCYYNLNRCKGWVGKLPVTSMRKQCTNTKQQINSQEKAENCSQPNFSAQVK